MADIKKLVELRKIIKSKKPTFRRTDYATRIKRKKEGWRTPRGRHNKIRQMFDGVLPGPAYGSPKAVRGAHATGMFEVMVNNVGELAGVDKAKVVRIAGAVGNKKRIDIVREAKKRGIHVLNSRVHIKPKKQNAPEAKAGKDAVEKQDANGVV